MRTGRGQSGSIEEVRDVSVGKGRVRAHQLLQGDVLCTERQPRLAHSHRGEVPRPYSGEDENRFHLIKRTFSGRPRSIFFPHQNFETAENHLPALEAGDAVRFGVHEASGAAVAQAVHVSQPQEDSTRPGQTRACGLALHVTPQLCMSRALHLLSFRILCSAPPAVDLLEALGRCVCARRACCFCLRMSLVALVVSNRVWPLW